MCLTALQKEGKTTHLTHRSFNDLELRELLKEGDLWSSSRYSLEKDHEERSLSYQALWKLVCDTVCNLLWNKIQVGFSGT